LIIHHGSTRSIAEWLVCLPHLLIEASSLIEILLLLEPAAKAV